MHDVIIIGGGPAGLSAALLLGRCRRRTLVCDAGQPRNAASRGLHAFLTRDGIPPSELLRIGREQLAQYDSVEIRDMEVTTAQVAGKQFRVRLRDGKWISARRILLATGVVDRLPHVEGFLELYGRSAFHCPYCDGWEVRDQPIAVYGKGAAGLGLVRSLRRLTGDLVLCTDGPTRWNRDHRAWLTRYRVGVYEQPIARLEGNDGQLERVVFANGEVLPRRAIFFNTGQGQRSRLAAQLGCDLTAKGSIRRNESGLTSVPGVFVAGDASRDVQLAIVAAAEGVTAAFAINKELLELDFDPTPK